MLTSQLEAPAVVPHTASKDDRKVSGILHQGIIDCKGTETRQIFSRMFVMARKLKSCLPLL